MITSNDYELRLFNGDVGVCWKEGPATFAFFRSETEDPRRVPVSKLPAHETSWAVTVHKSQGSEYERVLLVLPGADAPVLGRELLYTGVTRARERVAIRGTEQALKAAVERSAVRKSGLAEALTQA